MKPWSLARAGRRLRPRRHLRDLALARHRAGLRRRARGAAHPRARHDRHRPVPRRHVSGRRRGRAARRARRQPARGRRGGRDRRAMPHPRRRRPAARLARHRRRARRRCATRWPRSCPTRGRRSVPLAIEPLHPMYAADRACVNTLAQAQRSLRRAGRRRRRRRRHLSRLVGSRSRARDRARRREAILAYHVNDWLVPTTDLLLDRGMMGDGVIDLRAIRAMVESGRLSRPLRGRDPLRRTTGGSAIPTRSCASASSGTGRWCDGHHLRRHHPRRRAQRAHPAGLSRQGRPQDGGGRTPPGRRRRTEHARRPAPSRLPAQHPRLLPARDHRDAVVPRPRARAPRRAHTSSPSSTSRCSPATGARWNGGPISHKTIALVRRLQPPRRRDACAAGTTSSCRSCATSWRRRAARRRCRRSERRALLARTSAGRRLLEVSALSPLQFVEQEFEHPDHQGRAPVLQRVARGRSAAARLRPPHRRAAGEPGQGADVARRLGGAGARARSRGARGGRRDPADDRARSAS